jgi:putative nucleotidyltransferase-like protein
MRNDLLFAACRVSALAVARSVDKAESDHSRGGDPTRVDVEALRDWPYLRRAADRQGIAPLLHDWLGRHPAIDVPAETSAWLKDVYWTHHFRNRAFLAELDRLRQSAASRGLEFIPLKGAVLAADFYPAPALRPMSDLDLLVRAGDLPRMADLLTTSGYVARDSLPSYVSDPALEEQSREHVWAVKRDGIDVIVEYRAAALQTTIGRLGDFDATLASALRDCTEAMWSRATRASDGSLRPSREDLLLHGAAHLAAQHSDFRLIWLHDLARIVIASADAIDWDYICARAASLRIAVPTWAALDAAARWIDAPIDAAALERLRTAPEPGSSRFLRRWEQTRLSEHVARLGDADLSRPGFALWPFGAAVGRMRGWKPRLAALRWALFPSRDYLARHGEPSPGLFGYMKTWVRRAVMAVTRLSASQHRGRPL